MKIFDIPCAKRVGVSVLGRW